MSNLTLKEQLEALSLGSSSSAPTPEKKTKAFKKNAPTTEPVKQKPAWLEQAQYGVELLKAYFPTCFKEMKEIQPLKIGIKQDLVKRLSTLDVVLSDKACMVSSLAYYVSSPAYHRNVLEGSNRIDLDGNVAGVVTSEEAQYSLECRKSKLQKKNKSSSKPVSQKNEKQTQ